MLAKIRVILPVLLLLSLLPVLLMIRDSISTYRRYAASPRLVRLTVQVPRPVHRARVLILAHARTGSSFLGGIFNVHPDVFFLYEPLHTVERVKKKSVPTFFHQSKRVIHSIVNCSFSDDLYLDKASSFNHFRASSKPLVSPPFCNTSQEMAVNFAAKHQWEVCYGRIGARELNKVCRNYPHLFAKILVDRLQPADISWVLNVSAADSFPFRILHLVRDPRAMVASQQRVISVMRRSLGTGNPEKVVENICNITERNLAEVVRRPNHIELVRYEDLATKTEEVVKHLFTIYHISPSEDVLKWIRNKTRGSLNKDNYSLSRPAKFVLNAWRQKIPERLLDIVESKCKRVMESLGYIPTNGSRTMLRALDTPLFYKEMGDLKILLGGNS